MPLFYFYRCLDDEGRLELASAELSDREAARDFGIGLAEDILRGEDTEHLPVKSRIRICDDTGEELEVVISEGF